MQTLKERYAIRRLADKQRTIIREQNEKLSKNITLIESILLNEDAPPKEALKMAMEVVKKLDDIVARTNVKALETLVKNARNMITNSYKKAGTIEKFILWTKKKLNIQTPEENPIMYSLQLAKALIDGFSKLNDVVELHGVETQREMPKGLKKPRVPSSSDKSTIEKPVSEAEIDPESVTKYEQSLLNKNKPQQQKTVGFGDGSIGQSILQANPEYKNKINDVILNMFDAKKFAKFIAPKEFVNAVLSIPTVKVAEISSAFANMGQDVDAAISKLSQQAPQQQAAPDQDQQSVATGGDAASGQQQASTTGQAAPQAGTNSADESEKAKKQLENPKIKAAAADLSGTLAKHNIKLSDADLVDVLSYAAKLSEKQ